MKKIIAAGVLLVCAVIVSILFLGNKDKKSPLKKMSLELKPGVNIEFVECPAGSFTMGFDEDNSPFDEDNSPFKKHKVTITRPFWMATTKLTIEQWKTYREKYKAPEDAVKLGTEKAPLTKVKWIGEVIGFCKHLTKRFKDKIPPNYVFRFPTEAEWEYAYSADATEGYYSQKNVTDSKFGFKTDDINRIAKEKGLKERKHWDCYGVAVAQFPPNPWGLYDMAGNLYEYTLDTVDINDTDSHWAFDKKQTALLYAAEETDPLRIAPEDAIEVAYIGRGGDWGNKGKRQDGRAFRLCIGPDLVSEKKACPQKDCGAEKRKAAREKYPESDFGGKLISGLCKVDKISSEWKGFRSRLDCMLDSVKLKIRTGMYMMFHTDSEMSPYIQIQLPEKKSIAGLAIENRAKWCKERAVPLMVWVSDDKKEWKAVYEDGKVRDVYRCDLSKLDVSGRYIRIGRKPDVKKDSFHLGKIMIYAK